MKTMIPSPDILPLPAPPWLFMVLLTVTFLFHVIFMNLLFGGTLLALVSGIRGRKDPRHLLLSRTIYTFLPVVIAFTVNLGVAPLLFVQVLYGHLLYSSSILMAYAWFSVIPLVIFAYYGTYLLRFRWDRLGVFRTPLIIFVPAIFAAVAFIYVNNFTLMQHPGTWFAHYFRNPATGTLNWADISVYPRYLHVLFGAVAVSGVWVMVVGARGRTGDRVWSEWAVRYGAGIAVIATTVNIGIGFLFLTTHPGSVMMTFMGGNMPASAVFMVSLVVTLAALVILFRVRSSEKPRTAAYTGAALLLMVIALMIVMRQYLRAAYLTPFFTLSQLDVSPQWGTFGLFAALLVLIMLPAVAWLIKTVRNLKSPV